MDGEATGLTKFADLARVMIPAAHVAAAPLISCGCMASLVARTVSVITSRRMHAFEVSNRPEDND